MGGKARAAKLPAERRASIARKAAAKRWRMSPARVAELTAKNADEFRYALREFYRTAATERDPAILDRTPPPTSRPEFDAYLAAVAEAVALRYHWPAPRWVNARCRVLKQAYFGNAPAGMRIPLLQESPACFRKHNIFVDADEVSGALSKYEQA